MIYKIMRTAIITIAIGDAYRYLAELTHPSIKAYAEKIGADFIDIDRRSISTDVPHYEKFQIYHLLNKYERVMFIDTDIIIRPDCPSLFDEVPPEKIGAFNEGAFMDRSEPMRMIMEATKLKLEKWEGHYYNTGVLVVSRRHKFLFKKPEVEIINFWEQSYLNLIFFHNKVEFHNLDYKFNRMTVMDRFTGEHRRASYLVHYAGCPNFDVMRGLIATDLAAWDKEHPNYNYRRNIDIQVHGGIGDEACAEPVIRHIIEKAYPDANIFVTTWFPRLFMHLPVPVHEMNTIEYKNDTPYYRMDTMAQHGCPSWRHVSPNLLHTTDYSSIMCLRGIIPDEDKQIKLVVTPEDEEEIKGLLGDVDYEDAVVIHPGRHWPSKTFPVEYWNDVIRAIAQDHKVILIGKDVSDEQGVLDVEVPKGVYDARNLLTLGGLIAVISKAHTLLSNDSAPVHLAGAFDNHIILIPTCKHPDHVLPYRHGHRYYKARSICKKLTCAAVNSTPTQVHGQTIDYVVGDIMDYLPEPKDVQALVNSTF